MTRRPDLATVLLVALLASVALVLVPREAPASAPFPTRVQVTSTEFRLSMSRVVVPGGRVRIELVNSGRIRTTSRSTASAASTRTRSRKQRRESG